MPYAEEIVSVYFSANDCDSDDIWAVLLKRIAKKEWTPPPAMLEGFEPWCPGGLAADIRSAFYARNATRLENLLMVLERKEASK
jgi:hypothetical protein